jgi:hypothetical protein
VLSAALSVLEEPQAARENTMARASSKARSLFVVFMLEYPPCEYVLSQFDKVKLGRHMGTPICLKKDFFLLQFNILHDFNIIVNGKLHDLS